MPCLSATTTRGRGRVAGGSRGRRTLTNINVSCANQDGPTKCSIDAPRQPRHATGNLCHCTLVKDEAIKHIGEILTVLMNIFIYLVLKLGE